jgi:hypothetical protein
MFIFDVDETKPESDWTEQLPPATEGLLYPSETDAPVVPVIWPAEQTELTAAAVARLAGHTADLVIEESTLQWFFGRVTPVREWYDEYGRERSRRFAALESLLRENLRGIRVIRFGTIAIEVYVVGVDASDRIAGISTQVVET